MSNVELSEDQSEIAVRAAETLGLDIAGVDMLDSSRGPLVLEVNSSPGLEGIEKATRVNVAGKVAEHLTRLKRAIDQYSGSSSSDRLDNGTSQGYRAY